MEQRIEFAVKALRSLNFLKNNVLQHKKIIEQRAYKVIRVPITYSFQITV